MPITEAVDTSPLMRCYALLGICLPATFAPLPVIPGLGLAGLIGAIIWAYRLRKRDNELFHNHGRWLVRTSWISSLYFFIAVQLAGAIVSANADKTAIEGLADAMETGEKTSTEVAAMIMDFKAANADLILYTTLICFIPPLAYVLWRIIKGYRLAEAGQPVDKVTTWLM